LNSDVLSLRYDRDGEFLAMGCKNGTRMLYNALESISPKIQENTWLDSMTCEITR
jgi:hypothetical protein